MIGIFTNSKKNPTWFYYVIAALAFFLLCIFLLLSSKAILKSRDRKTADYTRQTAETIDRRISDALYDFMETNLERFMKQSTFSLFFEKKDASDMDFFMQMRISMVDSLRYDPFIRDLTLYRASDQAVISTADSGFSLSGNSSFDYVQSILAQEPSRTAGFLTFPDGEVCYYYPIDDAYPIKEEPLSGFAVATLRSLDTFFYFDVEKLSSSGTFVVMRQEELLYTKGSDVLSTAVIRDAVSSHAEKSFFYTENQSLTTPYRFYYISSPDSGLDYIYYEPQRAAWSWIAAAAEDGWLFPMCLAAICPLFFLVLNLARAAQAGRKLPESEAVPPPPRKFRDTVGCTGR